jgi:hypothetical protein
MAYRRFKSLYSSDEETEKDYRKRIIRAISLFSIALFFFLKFGFLRKLAVLGFFIALNFIFASLKRSIPLSFVRKYTYGVELVLICTVISGIRFGSQTGAFMGVILMAVNYVAENRASRHFFITLILYSFIGYFSYFYREFDIIYLGIFLSLVYNLFVFVFSKLNGANLVTLIIFNIINILYNVFLFSIYGQFLLNFLA